jgi:D-tyrosyl-tRNA(Tyr) deacylase
VIALLQRVSHAEVEVDGEVVGRIAAGLLVLLAVQPADTPAEADRLAERLVRYRVFADAAGRMNLSLFDTGGGLLLVPQFTLAADTRKGLRPSFTNAASPELGRALFERVASTTRAFLGEDRVATGCFGAHMSVSLTNDGPVTFWLETAGQTVRRDAEG